MIFLFLWTNKELDLSDHTAATSSAMLDSIVHPLAHRHRGPPSSYLLSPGITIPRLVYRGKKKGRPYSSLPVGLYLENKMGRMTAELLNTFTPTRRMCSRPPERQTLQALCLVD